MEADILAMLDQIAVALIAGDARAVAAHWAMPALVLGNDGAIAVHNPVEIERFFSQSIEVYRSKGTATTAPRDVRIEKLSDRLASVDVSWPSYDKDGLQIASERSVYIVWIDGKGQAKIRAALTRAA